MCFSVCDFLLLFFLFGLARAHDVCSRNFPCSGKSTQTHTAMPPPASAKPKSSRIDEVDETEPKEKTPGDIEVSIYTCALVCFFCMCTITVLFSTHLS